MRITELLEGKHFNDLDFVRDSEDGREIDFDLPEDLIHFMNSDDHVYRRHLHHPVLQCIHQSKKKVKTKPSLFKPAVENSYKLYAKKFPIRELPNELDEKMCNEICEKLHEQVCKDISEGKYKD